MRPRFQGVSWVSRVVPTPLDPVVFHTLLFNAVGYVTRGGSGPMRAQAGIRVRAGFWVSPASVMNGFHHRDHFPQRTEEQMLIGYLFNWCFFHLFVWCVFLSCQSLARSQNWKVLGLQGLNNASFFKKILFVKMSLAETFLSATNTTASEGKKTPQVLSGFSFWDEKSSCFFCLFVINH